MRRFQLSLPGQEPSEKERSEAAGDWAAGASVVDAIVDQGLKGGGAVPVIDLDDVVKTYTTGASNVTALGGVSLTISEGEFVSIMAPSGSGKSTLMHILGCLDVPTSGRYRLSGDDVSDLSETALAQIRNRRIGFVFQQFHLLGHLSAQKNVELPLVYANVARKDRERRALDALRRVGLGERADHRPNQLSGGQQQRVAIARALVNDPAVILADEPTGNLDSASSEEVLAWLEEFTTSGRTVVLITHEPDVALRAQRIVTMRDGHVTDDRVVTSDLRAAMGQRSPALPRDGGDNS